MNLSLGVMCLNYSNVRWGYHSDLVYKSSINRNSDNLIYPLMYKKFVGNIKTDIWLPEMILNTELHNGMMDNLYPVSSNTGTISSYRHRISD